VGSLLQDYDGRQIRVNLAGDKPPPRAREFWVFSCLDK
jgi:hypothetical protein